ncbi:MAG: hypothetical protein AAF206_19690 [Bacteroidota bacterium]
MKKLLILTLSLLSMQLMFAQESEQEILDEFFKLYNSNTSEAIDYIYSSNKWIDNEGEAVQNIKTKLNELQPLLGTYYGGEFVHKGQLGESFVTYIYLAKYERQPLRFTFEFYKADDTWITYSFKFDDSFDDDLEELMMDDYMRRRN